MTAARPAARAALAAGITAAAMIAHQVAGKATRDAFFLSQFDVTLLPRMLMVAALLSVIAVLTAARLLAVQGPARVIAGAFAGSAVMHLLAWGLALQSAQAAAAVTYLHVSVLGPVLISGFWTLVIERFDPRTAKREVARLAGVGIVGGLFGGVVADRVGAAAGVVTMLPVLAVLHGVCAWTIRPLGSEARQSRPAPSDAGDEGHAAPGGWTGEGEAPALADPFGGLRILSATPYLRNLGLLVFAGTVGAALLDYVFKSRAVAAGHGGPELVRLFSIFYFATALAAFVIQTGASRALLERLGLARTAAFLPGTIALGGAALMAWPGLIAAVLARGGEGAVRSSVFRSAYEILFTPIPAHEKRATKALVDVGCDRLGDAVGGAVIALVLLGGPALAAGVLPPLALGLGALGLLITLGLRRGYVTALEASLARGAVRIDPALLADSTTRGAMHAAKLLSGAVPIATGAAPLRAGGPVGELTQRIDLAALRAGLRADAPAAPPARFVDRYADLASAESERIRAALVERLTPELVPHVLPLLGRDEVAAEAIASLRRVGHAVTGQLVDALLDPATDVVVRRRIPRVLAAVTTARSVTGLMAGLADPRFDVRVRCGQALARLHDSAPGLAFDEQEVYAAVLREVDVERGVWESRRELEQQLEPDSAAPVYDFLRTRAHASLAHVFTLLALVLPPQYVQIAFRGLHAGDPNMRGMSLEYLESVLPQAIRARLWPFLEEREGKRPPPRPREEILQDLVQSNESIRIRISELERRARPT